MLINHYCTVKNRKEIFIMIFFQNTRIIITSLAIATLLATQQTHTQYIASLSFAHWGYITSKGRIINCPSKLKKREKIIGQKLLKNGVVKAWDLTKRGRKACIRTIEKSVPEENLMYDLAISPKKSRIIATVSCGNKIELWDLTQPKGHEYRETLTEHERSIQSITFDCHSPHRIASTSDDGIVIIYDLAQKKFEKLIAHCRRANSATFCPHNQNIIATTAADGTAKLFDLRNPRETQCVKTLSADKYEVQSASFSPLIQHEIATASVDGTIRIWDTRKTKCLKKLKHKGQEKRITFDPNNRHIITSLAKNLNLKKPLTLQKLPAPDDQQDFSFLNHTVKIWNISQPEGEELIRGAVVKAQWIEANPLNPYIMAFAFFNRAIKIRNTKTSQPLKTLKRHTNSIRKLVFPPDLPEQEEISPERALEVPDQEYY